MKGPKPCINLYRINPAGKMINKGQVPITSFPFCHDFALDRQHAIFFVGSIVFGGMGSVMLGTNEHFRSGAPSISPFP